MMKKANQNAGYNIYDLNAAYGKVRQSVAGLLSVTFDKMLQFRKEDGSFSYYTNRSAASMYNAPISLGLNEGDVNATHLMVGSMCSAIFSSMGVERPKTWSSADLDVFLSVIEEAGEIVKIDRDTGVSYDFEGFSEGDVPNGIVGAEIVADPKNYENSAIVFNSVVGTKDNATFSVAFGESYSCAYFETDLMLSNVTHATSTNNIPTHQVRFAAGGSYVYMLTFTAKDGMLIIGDNSSTSSGGIARNNLISVPLDEWFNLRVEIYSGDAEQFRAKIYVNGHCLVISDNFYGSESANAVPNAKITSIVFYGMEKAGSTLYFDNVDGDITGDRFSDEDYEGEVESNEKLYDFEDEKFDFISVETSFAGSYIGISDEVAKDDYSLVLHKESTDGNRDHYVFGTPEIKSDTLTLSFDVNFDHASGGGMQIALGAWGKSPYVLNIMYSGGAYKLGCTRNTADTAATALFDGGELSPGWHNIRITMTITDDPDEFCADIYVDGELLVSSPDFYHGGKDGAVPAISVPEITFKLLKQFIGDVYLDNVHMIYD